MSESMWAQAQDSRIDIPVRGTDARAGKKAEVAAELRKRGGDGGDRGRERQRQREGL